MKRPSRRSYEKQHRGEYTLREPIEDGQILSSFFYTKHFLCITIKFPSSKHVRGWHCSLLGRKFITNEEKAVESMWERSNNVGREDNAREKRNMHFDFSYITSNAKHVYLIFLWMKSYGGLPLGFIWDFDTSKVACMHAGPHEISKIFMSLMEYSNSHREKNGHNSF